MDLHRTAGKSVDGGRLIGHFEAGLFRKRSGDEVEGRRGVEHETVWTGIDVDGKIGETKRVLGDLKQKRVIRLDGHGRIRRSKGQKFERKLDFALLIGAQMVLETRFESLIGLCGFGQVAGPKVVLSESFAEQLFASGVATDGDLIELDN